MVDMKKHIADLEAQLSPETYIEVVGVHRLRKEKNWKRAYNEFTDAIEEIKNFTQQGPDSVLTATQEVWEAYMQPFEALKKLEIVSGSKNGIRNL